MPYFTRLWQQINWNTSKGFLFNIKECTLSFEKRYKNKIKTTLRIVRYTWKQSKNEKN